VNQSHYDFTTLPAYGKRQMFLDGRVTIQRYDDYAYPMIAKYEDQQQGSFWRPGEINLSKDQIDFKEASKAVRHIFTSNLLRQTALDSIQGRAPVQVFTPVVSVPEMEALVNAWSFFEIIHSRSYSHIIRNVYNVPKDEFNRIHDTKPIVEMAANIGEYYDKLHKLNCKVELGHKVSEYDHIKAIYLALVASYALEAIRFMVSFATSLGMVENKIFIGNGNIISLILQDELLHTEWSAWILNRVIKDDPRFAQVARDCAEEARQIMLDTIREEKEWAKYIFQEGTVIGMNEKIMCAHVDWTAQSRMKDIGMKYDAGVKSPPLPWFGKHMNTNKKQTALQESENVAYVIGSMTSSVNYAELPDL
jgi:ribonucleoside-diphosphate reductase beta chain